MNRCCVPAFITESMLLFWAAKNAFATFDGPSAMGEDHVRPERDQLGRKRGAFEPANAAARTFWNPQARRAADARRYRSRQTTFGDRNQRYSPVHGWEVYLNRSSSGIVNSRRKAKASSLLMCPARDYVYYF